MQALFSGQPRADIRSYLLRLFSLRKDCVFLARVFVLSLHFQLSGRTGRFALLSSVCNDCFTASEQGGLSLQTILVSRRCEANFSFFSCFNGGFKCGAIVVVKGSDMAVTFPSIWRCIQDFTLRVGIWALFGLGRVYRSAAGVICVWFSHGDGRFFVLWDER